MNMKVSKNIPDLNRIPRPMGLTLLSINYQKDKSDTNKSKVLKHLITQYTLAGFRLNNQPVSIPDLAILIQTKEEDIMDQVSKVSTSIGAFNSPAQIKDTLTSIASLSTSWAIQDRGLVMAQVELLARAQAGTYKPFISSELNKALKLGLDANKNFMEIYKTFFTQQQTNILNIFNTIDDSNKDYVTPQQALDMALELRGPKSLPSPGAEQGSLSDNNDVQNDSNANFGSDFISTGLLSEDKLGKLFEKHNLGESPEVREKRSGTEALRAGQLDSQSVTEPVSLKAKRRESSLSSHSDPEKRRGEEYIDYDEVD